jgi:hypothetical protein
MSTWISLEQFFSFISALCSVLKLYFSACLHGMILIPTQAFEEVAAISQLVHLYLGPDVIHTTSLSA